MDRRRCPPPGRNPKAGRSVKSDPEQFRKYANRISHETRKFDYLSKIRLELARDSKKWLRLQQIASKRFVLKIIRMVENFR